MNILLFGSGGREHAIAAKLRLSKRIKNLFVAPGNAGTQTVAQNINLDWRDTKSVVAFIEKNAITMVVIGPEEPLVLGLADELNAAYKDKNLIVIGPTKRGAQLEGSKAFSKKFMQAHQIPTARYAEITTLADGKAFLKTLAPPYVLKADGLAAGKGVVILNNLEDAYTELNAMLDGKFGAASQTVVIEEFLSGIEFSVFALTDGNDYVILPEAKDYKRIGEGDTGLNTGGMGAVSPVSFFTKKLKLRVIEKIIEPTLHGLKTDAVPYVGFIFFGLILVKNEPYVIEYNCRLGDPETQVVLARLKNDLITLFEKAGTKNLKNARIQIDKRATVATVLAAGGYPETYAKGAVISLKKNYAPDEFIFHAGTTLNAIGELVTNGGRVMACVALAETTERAAEKSRALADSVTFADKYFRRDVGRDVLAYEQKK